MAAEYLERMGERIRARREEMGLSQEDVAREMPGKVTGQRVSLWERGKNRPRDDSLEALAGVLGVPVSYLLAAEPDKAETPDLVETMAGDGRSSDDLSGRIARLEEIALQNQQLLLALASEAGITEQPAAARALREVDAWRKRKAAEDQRASRSAPAKQRRATG